MNMGCFPRPNRKKSVFLEFGLSLPFGLWRCEGLGLGTHLQNIFANPKHLTSHPFQSETSVLWTGTGIIISKFKIFKFETSEKICAWTPQWPMGLFWVNKRELAFLGNRQWATKIVAHCQPQCLHFWGRAMGDAGPIPWKGGSWPNLDLCP